MRQSWYLSPPGDMERTSDEFVVAGGLHITVHVKGGTLDLEVDEPAPAAAEDAMRTLATAYAQALSDNGLLRRLTTEAEFAALPPCAFQNLDMSGGADRVDTGGSIVR